MKKIVLPFTFAALLLSGCTKVQNEEVVPEKSKHIATLKADIDNSDTRVGVTIGQGGATATYSWQPDDEILVSTIFTNELGTMYSKTRGAIRSGSISSNGGTAHFDVELDDGCVLGKYAFYPVNWWCDAFPEGIYFGLSSDYYYDEGAANVPMLGTITSTGVIFRPVCGLLQVTIENIPTNAHLLHFSVDGKKITGCFPVAGSPGNHHVNVENLGEYYQETDGDYIDIWFGGEGGDPEGGEFPEGGDDPEGGEGEIIGVRSPMTFYIPLPCGKYNNLSFSICEDDSYTPLFTRVARMDNNHDGVFSDEEGIEIRRNEVVLAPTLEFVWDQNLPKTIVLDVEDYQYEDELDENNILHVDQYDHEIGFIASIQGKYSRALDEFDPSLISCQLVNVTDPENITKAPITFEYAEDYDFDNDFDGSEVILNVSIPTNNVGEFKLEVSYGTLTPTESFKVKVYPVVPIPAALGENWAYDYYFSPQVHVSSEWFKPYWNKDAEGNVYLKTRVASSRSEALPDYAFRGSFGVEDEGGSFDAFEYFTQITSIPTNAFWGCEYLTGIKIPSSVTSIGTYAFRKCESLAEIELPDGLTSIGNYAFADCYRLTSIELPSGVTSIGDFAFNYSWRLESINLDNVSSIGQNAFAGCDALTEINTGDVTIGDYAFEGCDELNRVTIGTSIPNSSATIGTSAFGDCENLSEVNLISVSSIGSYAFSWCSSLNSITLSNNLTTIGAGAFWASGLRTITIPNSVTSIEDSAFSYCNSLEYIVFENTTPPAVENIESWFYLDEGASNAKIYVPAEALEAYQSAWSAVEDHIEVKPANL